MGIAVTPTYTHLLNKEIKLLLYVEYRATSEASQINKLKQSNENPILVSDFLFFIKTKNPKDNIIILEINGGMEYGFICTLA